MPPPGKPKPPRERPLPPFPGLPIRFPDVMLTSLAHGDFVIIRSTSLEFQSLAGLVSQKSLEPKAHAGRAADVAGSAVASRIKLRLVSTNVRRTGAASRLRAFHSSPPASVWRRVACSRTRMAPLMARLMAPLGGGEQFRRLNYSRCGLRPIRQM